MQSIDQLIRAGRGREARQQIRKLAAGTLTRIDRLNLASLARRANLPEIGIRLLRPCVRAQGRRASAASGAEKAEYAASLIKIGAASEALQLLKEVDVRQAPDALLFRAFGLISQWNYADALAPLGAYVRSPELTEYQRLVGQTNLATALFCEHEHEQSAVLTAELLERTQAQGLTLLHGTLLELAAQNAIFSSSWDEATRYLDLASGTLEQSAGNEELFVRKWRSVMQLLRDGPGKSALQALSEVRAEAVKRRHWETARDCDLFDATVTQNEGKLVHLYFGTPYPSFRKRILAEFGKPVQIPASYRWGEGNLSLDLTEPESRGLKAGQLLHRLLLSLTADFYQPARLAALHSAIFSDENYHPVFSPDKVHQAMKRLRLFLAEREPSITVMEESGRYRLKTTGSIQLPLQRPGAVSDIRLARLVNHFGREPFAARDAATFLGLSSRMASRALNDAVAQKAVQRSGQARATLYRFTPVDGS